MHTEKNGLERKKAVLGGQETMQSPTHTFIDELNIQLTCSAYIS